MRRHFATLFLFALCAAAPAPAQTAPCTPGVTFRSLLGAVDVGGGDGRVHIDKLYAICLPPPKVPSHSNYAYSPDEGGKLTSMVKDAQGQTLATYVWYAENIGGLWELGNYKVFGGYESTKPLVPGEYWLQFSADGALFYRFPFAVAAADSDDPYASPGKRYFIEGAWNDYGNLFYQRNDPESSLQFTVWVQDRATHPPQHTRPYAAQFLRVRDGKVLGEDRGELRSDRTWKPLELLFRSAEGDGNSYLKAKEMLREDGVYRFTFTLDGAPYATYPFKVAGGKIEVMGLQADSAAAQTRIVDYLYGGRYRSWWIPRTANPRIAY